MKYPLVLRKTDKQIKRTYFIQWHDCPKIVIIGDEIGYSNHEGIELPTLYANIRLYWKEDFFIETSMTMNQLCELIVLGYYKPEP